ncbi:hypothetical protein [Stappia sp. 28M-7]|nr:hypothetical protein [Stappia sp. 28M-7]
MVGDRLVPDNGFGSPIFRSRQIVTVGTAHRQGFRPGRLNRADE